MVDRNAGTAMMGGARPAHYLATPPVSDEAAGPAKIAGPYR